MTLTRPGKTTRWTAVAALVTAMGVPLAAPPASLAHSLTLDTARAVAKKEAAKIKRDTDADSSAVKSCRRLTVHKMSCKIVSHYSTGLSSCTTSVLVYYTSHSDRTPGIKIGRSVCS